jgi:hypothetical protein
MCTALAKDDIQTSLFAMNGRTQHRQIRRRLNPTQTTCLTPAAGTMRGSSHSPFVHAPVAYLNKVQLRIRDPT